MPYILFSLKVKGTTQEQLIMGFPVYSTIYKFYILVRPELFNMLRITHKDFKNGCFFFKGLGWSRPNLRDLKVPRPRQDRDFSYPRPRPGLRDLQKMVLRPRPRPRPGLETTTLFSTPLKGGGLEFPKPVKRVEVILLSKC